jgi:uncharacterized protein (TIGR03435 family)
LKVHVETRDEPVYALTVIKGGPKMKPAPDATGGATVKFNASPDEVANLHRGLMVCAEGQGFEMTVKGMTLAAFTDALQSQKELRGLPVIDRTGLTAAYDFTLSWGPELTASADNGDPADSGAPPLLAAVQEQLGLKLGESKGPAEVLVVDHIERPVPQDKIGMMEPRSSAAPSQSAAVETARPNLQQVALVRADSVPSATAVQSEKQGAKLPAYDVVTIKPNRSAGVEDYDLDGGLDTFSATGISLKKLLESANGMRDEQISGIPAEIDSARFDIEAKIVDNDLDTLKKLTPKQRSEMLLSVLVERFHLQTHTETKTLPVYELVVAKGGPKFNRSAASLADTSASRHMDSHGRRELWLTIENLPLTSLIEILEGQVHRNVVDRTGLAGNYGFTLKWTREGISEEPAESYPGIFTALQEQLGLKLQPSTGPVKALVIDHVEMPSAN